MIRYLSTLIIFLTCLTNLWGKSAHSIPYDSVNYEIFKDTLYDHTLPPVEVELISYSNFHRITVGYQLTLRDAEFDIRGVEVYVHNPQKKHKTIEPFNLHVGNRNDHNRIDKVTIWNKFPFDTIGAVTDSMVIITDRGNLTLYLSEEMRTEQSVTNQCRALVTRTEELQAKNQYLLLWFSFIIAIFIVFVIVVIIRYYRHKKRDNSVANIVVAMEENEIQSKSYNEFITTLFKQNFATLNKLCYEYYEKGDTQSLRKNIFLHIEKEILKFREPKEIAVLERDLNKYLDNIMVHVDEQLPSLTETEHTLLIYLFSGFSARTVCTICDLEIKTFYMRRYRLKNKILASDAHDKDLFVKYM